MNTSSTAVIRVRDTATGNEFAVESNELVYVPGDSAAVRNSVAEKVRKSVPGVKNYVVTAIIDEWASPVGRRTLFSGWWHIGGGIQLHAEAK